MADSEAANNNNDNELVTKDDATVTGDAPSSCHGVYECNDFLIINGNRLGMCDMKGVRVKTMDASDELALCIDWARPDYYTHAAKCERGTWIFTQRELDGDVRLIAHLCTSILNERSYKRTIETNGFNLKQTGDKVIEAEKEERGALKNANRACIELEAAQAILAETRAREASGNKDEDVVTAKAGVKRARVLAEDEEAKCVDAREKVGVACAALQDAQAERGRIDAEVDAIRVKRRRLCEMQQQ